LRRSRRQVFEVPSPRFHSPSSQQPPKALVTGKKTQRSLSSRLDESVAAKHHGLAALSCCLGAKQRRGRAAEPERRARVRQPNNRPDETSLAVRAHLFWLCPRCKHCGASYCWSLLALVVHLSLIMIKKNEQQQATTRVAECYSYFNTPTSAYFQNHSCRY
jgi:hypothetical protein